MILSIGRQLGAGGIQIAELLGKKFGIEVYDNKLLALAAEESGICAKHFEQADEQTRYARATRWLSSHVPLFFGAYGQNQGLTNQELFQLQSDAIRDIAAKGDCIFIGRCADYILRSRTDLISVFICADINDRISRIAALDNITPHEAQSKIRHTDRQRAKYYNFYTEKLWGDAASYDLSINSSVLGIEKTADFIAEFINTSKITKR